MRKLRFCWLILLVMFATVTAANAVIQVSPTGVGDALLFPFFDADKENYVLITNESDDWVQVHVRLRTAAHSVEGLDFPLILSPGDIAVFELTSNGYDDGLWRVDYTVDPHNFEYVLIEPDNNVSLYDLAESDELKNNFMKLEPPQGWSDEAVAHDKQYGYIEVIGEAVFNYGLSKTSLLNGNPTCAMKEYEDSLASAVITDDDPLDGVGNVLSGKLYVMESEYGTGIAYNATAFQDFRTESALGTHRVENYLDSTGAVMDTEVILTSYNSTVDLNSTLVDDYNYSFDVDLARATAIGIYEAMVSANNTWGPTFADGDDYLGDNLDNAFGGVTTSVREFESALREVSVRGHYFAAEGFATRLIVTLPTKHHVVVRSGVLGTITDYDDWLDKYNDELEALAPAFDAEVWDTDENVYTVTTVEPFCVSPCLVETPDEDPNVLPYELTILEPAAVGGWETGRFVLSDWDDNASNISDLLVEYTSPTTLPLVAMTYIDMSGAIGYLTETQY